MPSGLASSSLPRTRSALQQVAVHVLGHRRYDVTGHFGLRPTPGGLGTPAFGADVEVVRVSGHSLVHERGGAVARHLLSTLAAAAEFVGVDLSEDFSVGADTPPLVDIDAPLAIVDGDVRTLAEWWSSGVAAIDDVVATDPRITEPTVIQLWPEHFDVGCSVAVGGSTLNLGASPGDGSEELPYLYVSPWSGERPGDPSYWNAPFGALLRAGDIADLPPAARHLRATAFIREGLARW